MAQEIWQLLKGRHDEASEIEDSKISLLSLQYEAFKMEVGENINKMDEELISRGVQK